VSDFSSHRTESPSFVELSSGKKLHSIDSFLFIEVYHTAPIFLGFIEALLVMFQLHKSIRFLGIFILVIFTMNRDQQDLP